jgi:predicted RNase H-like HicB family nuclease
MRYPVRLIHEDNGTVTAIVTDLPGAHSFGDSEAEALDRAVDAAETAIIGRIASRFRRPPERNVDPRSH